MPTAEILVNTLVPPQDVPINVVVALSNAGTGGEVTYEWTLLDQPEGPADALVGPATPTPTITPRKEGSYLLQLVVNKFLSTVRTALAKFDVRNFIDGRSPPAAGETTQQSLQRGWAEEVNRQLNDVTSLRKDPGCVAGQIGFNGGIGQSSVLYAGTTVEIKTGLPGAEYVPYFNLANATSAFEVGKPLYLLDPRGPGGAGPSAGQIVWARQDGVAYAVPIAGATIDDPVYVSDAGLLELTPGTYARQVGIVLAARLGDCDVLWLGQQGSLQQLASMRRFSSRGAGYDGAANYVWPLAFGYQPVPPTATDLGLTAGSVLKVKAEGPGRWQRLRVWVRFEAHPRTIEVYAYLNGVKQALGVQLVSTANPSEVDATDYDPAHAFAFNDGDYVELRAENVTAIAAYNEIGGITASLLEQLFL